MTEQKQSRFPKPWAERIEHISILVRKFTDCLQHMGATAEELAIVYTGAVTRLLEQKHGVGEQSSGDIASMTNAEVDEEIRQAGGDPDAIGSGGAALAEELLEKLRPSDD